MKKLLILGAGIYQVPLIKKAKEMGIYTIVVSIQGNYPGFELADKVCYLDTRDKNGILQAAEEEAIDGICTSGTDVAVRSIGYVCSRMHLFGIEEEAAKIVTDKALMKACFQKGGVSTAAFKQAFSKEEAEKTAEEIGFPVVVKAVDKSGSRGIQKACNKEELLTAYEAAVRVTDKDYVLIEEFIDAPEIGVDAFIGNDGNIEVLFPHDKFVYRAGNTTIPEGHRFPYPCEPSVYEEIRRQIQKAAHSVGMKNCPLNADVFVKNGKVWIIEIGGRTGATCIPELISMYCGYDWYEKIILAALGENPEFSYENPTPCMAKLLFSKEDGVLESIDWDKLSGMNNENVKVQLDYREGDRIEAMKDGTDRIGHLIMKTDKEEVLNRMKNAVYGCIGLNGRTMEELWKK